MRIHSSLRRPIAFALCALFALVATFGGALVLCEEADGSVRIEIVGAACCETEPELPVPELPVEDDCGGCTDEALTGSLPDTIVRRGSAVSEGVPDLSLFVSFAQPATPSCEIDATRDLFTAGEPRPPELLTARRTVVLLV